MREITTISVEEIRDDYPHAQAGQYACYLHTIYTDSNDEVIHEDTVPVNVSDDNDDVIPDDYKLKENEYFTIHYLAGT